jgi:hypothetical protein
LQGQCELTPPASLHVQQIHGKQASMAVHTWTVHEEIFTKAPIIVNPLSQTIITSSSACEKVFPERNPHRQPCKMLPVKSQIKRKIFQHKWNTYWNPKCFAQQLPSDNERAAAHS